jgi:hypothetical protein
MNRKDIDVTKDHSSGVSRRQKWSDKPREIVIQEFGYCKPILEIASQNWPAWYLPRQTRSAM